MRLCEKLGSLHADLTPLSIHNHNMCTDAFKMKYLSENYCKIFFYETPKLIISLNKTYSKQTSNTLKYLSFQEWAKDHLVREEYLFKIKMVYYVLFCFVLTMSFLILPLTFFYHTTSPLGKHLRLQQTYNSENHACLYPTILIIKYTCTFYG